MKSERCFLAQLKFIVSFQLEEVATEQTGSCFIFIMNKHR